MRESQISRKTAETDISLQLVIEGSGSYDVRSGSYFFDHMLEQVARHGSFDLYLRCSGDVEVDFHHSVEDVGICLGEAFRDALGDKRGIRRYGSIILPMDESLALCALDFSGRTHLNFDVQFPPEYKVGDLDRAHQGIFRGVREVRLCHPAHQTALRRECAPHRGGGVQGVCARTQGSVLH